MLTLDESAHVVDAEYGVGGKNKVLRLFSGRHAAAFLSKFCSSLKSDLRAAWGLSPDEIGDIDTEVVRT